MSKTKESLLIEYAKSGDDANLQRLLEENLKLDVNISDQAGNTALMFAVQTDNKAIAKLLVDRGADPSIKNNLEQDTFDIMLEDDDYDDMLSILHNSPIMQKAFSSNRSRDSSLSSLNSNDSTTELASYNKENAVDSILQQLKTMSPSEIIQLRDSLPKNIADSLLGEKTIEATARPISVQPGSPLTIAKVEIAPPVKIVETNASLSSLRPAVISTKPIPTPPPLPEADFGVKQPKLTEPNTSVLTTEQQPKSIEEQAEELRATYTRRGLPSPAVEKKVADFIREEKAKLPKVEINTAQTAMDQKSLIIEQRLESSIHVPAVVLRSSTPVESVANTIDELNAAITEQKISAIVPLVKQLAGSTDPAAKTALEAGLVKLIEISPAIWQTELNKIKVAAQACKIKKDKIENIEQLKNKVLQIYSELSPEELISLHSELTQEQREQYKITSIKDALPIPILLQNKQNSFSSEEQQILGTLSSPTSLAKYGSGRQKTEHNINNQFNDLQSLVEKSLATEATKLNQKVKEAKTTFQTLRSAVVAIKDKIGVTERITTALDEIKQSPEVVKVKNEFASLINSNIDYDYKNADGQTESIKSEASAALLPSTDIVKVFTSVLKVAAAPVVIVTQKAPTFSTAHIEVNPLIAELATNNKTDAMFLACEQAVPKIQELQQLDKILEANNLVSTQLKTYIQEVATHFAKAVDPGAVASLKPMIIKQAKDNPAQPLNLSAEEAMAKVITELKLAGLTEDKIRIITRDEYNLEKAQKEAQSAASAARSAGTKHARSPTKKASVTSDALTGVRLRSSTSTLNR